MKCILLAVALVAAPVAGFAKDYSVTLTTTPTLIIPAATGGPRSFFRMMNVEPTGSASAWCSRILTTTLAANVPGAYEIKAGGGYEQYISQNYVPPDAEWCVAATGTVRFTAESNQ